MSSSKYQMKPVMMYDVDWVYSIIVTTRLIVISVKMWCATLRRQPCLH